MIHPDQGDNEVGCFIVPNAILLIKDGPHPEAAEKTDRLSAFGRNGTQAGAVGRSQIPLHAGVETPPIVRKIETMKTMKCDYAAVARKMREIEPLLRQWVGY